MNPSDTAGTAIDFEFIHLPDQMKEIDVSEEISQIIQE